MEYKVVKTPKIDIKDELTFKEICTQLNAEFKANNNWTERCSKLLKENLTALFKYDRFEFVLGRAYGNSRYKIGLNPLMILCYHPSCLCKEKPVIKLRHMYDLDYYVMHLLNHNDTIGIAMHRRFAAVSRNNFISIAELDKISTSPFSLNPLAGIPIKAAPYLESFGISRKFEGNYVCHWKSKFLEADIIDPTSLLFQEDEAFIYSVLHYPNPVRDWSVWGSLSFYCLKLYSSLSATALSLYRGVTRNRLTRNALSNLDLQTYVASINHPGPSVSTVQAMFPCLDYENEVYHTTELIFHLTLLAKLPDIVKISYANITRFPVTLVIDEQEINPGSFEHKGHLYGLKNKMSCEDISKLGLANLAQYIADENNFIIAVREYRLVDFSGKFCSNVYSTFESASLTHAEVSSSLEKVLKLSRKCMHCLENKLQCEYERLDTKCTACQSKNIHCISLNVFFVIWDMGSSHKKTTELFPQIDILSTTNELMSANLVNFGIGGLHLCKAIVNASRNFILTSGGENFGINILRAYKFKDELASLKNAVFLAKDRQSDFLAYLTVSKTVQDALKKMKVYQIVRVPELLLTYKENAKSQKPFVHPVTIATNLNGDIFVLDTGAPCIHVINRATVSKVVIVGKHMLNKYNVSKNSRNLILAKDVKLSYDLRDMIIVDECIYVADKERGEILIIKGVSKANFIFSSTIHVLEVKDCISLSVLGKNLVVLQKIKDISRVSILQCKLPEKQKYALNLNYNTIFSVVPAVNIDQLFVVPSTIHFGVVTEQKCIYFFSFSNKSIKVEPTEVEASIKPSANTEQLIVYNSNKINKYSVFTTKCSIQIKDCSSSSPSNLSGIKIIHQWRNVSYIIRKVDTNVFYLEEFGSFDFGYKFCSAIDKFYSAISYTPPNKKAGEKLKLNECIDEASSCVDLLRSMQEEKEKSFPSRTSFIGADGVPFSATMKCLISTVESWKSLHRRLKFFDLNLPEQVYTHSVTNESLIEHSFGFVNKQGQGHLQTVKEYVESKRKHSIDFIIQLCNTPFNQYVKSKLQDKGYQEIDRDRDLLISYKELCKILKPSIEEQVEVVLSQEESNILKKAYLLSKSVPRQSNRSKWKEKSGFSPNMLTEQPPNGFLLKGDLVFYRGIDNILKYLLVKKDIKLIDIQDRVEVTEVGKDASDMDIPIGNLLKDNGAIAIVPHHLYSIVNNHINFKDASLDLVEKLKCVGDSSFSEEDWADIMSDNTTHDGKQQQQQQYQQHHAQQQNNQQQNNQQQKQKSQETNSQKRKMNMSTEMKKKVKKNQFCKEIEECWVTLLSQCCDSLIGKWVACVYLPYHQSKVKAKPQLIFGRLVSRVQLNDNTCSPSQYQWNVSCCKPFNLAVKSNIIFEVPLKPDGSPGDLWLFYVYDIFFIDLNATYLDKGQWEISGMEEIISLFHMAKGVKRDELLSNVLS